MGWQEKIVAQGAHTGDVRVQYGALCWCLSGADVKLLLITSLDTKRWIIPKGWPMPGLSPEASAAQEAWEEAGVVGDINPLCLGRYGYQKGVTVQTTVPCAVGVFGLKVSRLADEYPEMKERRRKWFSTAEAALLVDEPDLACIIAGFTPPVTGRTAPISGESEYDADPPQAGRLRTSGRKSH